MPYCVVRKTNCCCASAARAGCGNSGAIPVSSEFWDMSGYAVYVWGSFGAALIIYGWNVVAPRRRRSEEHTSELQSLMRISYAVFCLKIKNTNSPHHHNDNID